MLASGWANKNGFLLPHSTSLAIIATIHAAGYRVAQTRAQNPQKTASPSTSPGWLCSPATGAAYRQSAQVVWRARFRAASSNFVVVHAYRRRAVGLLYNWIFCALTFNLGHWTDEANSPLSSPHGSSIPNRHDHSYVQVLIMSVLIIVISVNISVNAQVDLNKPERCRATYQIQASVSSNPIVIKERRC